MDYSKIITDYYANARQYEDRLSTPWFLAHATEEMGGKVEGPNSPVWRKMTLPTKEGPLELTVFFDSSGKHNNFSVNVPDGVSQDVARSSLERLTARALDLASEKYEEAAQSQ